MKAALFALFIFTMFFGFACRQKVESLEIAENKVLAELPQSSKTPNKYQERHLDDELQRLGQFSSFDEENKQTLLKFKDFTIQKVVVRKSDGRNSPVTDIVDSALMKNGKTLVRFEGVYHPLGNEMTFALFPFLGGSESQLLVSDESLHYKHNWIIKLSPKFKVLFDNEDYVIYEGFNILDADNDGVFEISSGIAANLGFVFSRSTEMPLKIIFRYDTKSNRYLPATHLFPKFVLNGFEKEGFDEQLGNFKKREKNKFVEFVQIFMKFIYAGKEEEAWKFFEENFSLNNIEFGDDENKINTKQKIISALNKDKIYQFIKNDTKNP